MNVHSDDGSSVIMRMFLSTADWVLGDPLENLWSPTYRPAYVNVATRSQRTSTLVAFGKGSVTIPMDYWTGHRRRLPANARHVDIFITWFRIQTEVTQLEYIDRVQGSQFSASGL